MKLTSILFRIILILLFYQLTGFSQIKFAWITDTHIGSPNADKDLLNIINDINQRDILFTILTGDITEKGSNTELIEAKNILSRLNRPYFIIPGNHDTKWSESGTTKFSELFGDDRFIFSLNDYCFIGINSGIPLRGGGGHISIEDLNWLQKKLSSLDRETKVILAVHHQLDKEIDNSNRVIELLRNFESAFIIVGHGHANREYNFNGVKGAMGRSALSKGQNPGYNIVSLLSDSIFIQTIDFVENKIWYKNSLSILSSKKPKDKTKEIAIKEIKEIFNSNTTIVKTGFWDKNNLFVADLSGYVYSINLNGRLNWKKFFPTSFYARPISHKNRLIICGTDGLVYILNKINGKLIKKINIGSSIIATPVLSKNYLIIFSSDGFVTYLDLKNFNLIRRKVGEKHFETTPLYIKNKIVIGNWDNFLYAISDKPVDTNLIVWKWTENKNFYYSPAACSPVIDKFSRIFISTPDKFISGIDVRTGKTLYRSNEFNSWEAIGIDEAREILYIKGVIDTIYSLSLKDSIPVLKWKAALNYSLDTNPVNLSVYDKNVFIPAKNGYLYIIDKETGRVIKSYFLGQSRLNDIIIVSKSLILVSNMDGKICLIKIN